MPIDKDGNRADIVMDGNATVDRMNWGRLFEQYLNAASRDITKRIREMLGVGHYSELHESNPNFDQAWALLMDYYATCSSRMKNHFMDPQMDRLGHLRHVMKNGIYLYIPPENEILFPDMVRAIQKKYPPTYGKIQYVDMAGKQVTTKEDIRVGSVYVILLEKTGDDWTAVSSGVLQHFGVLGPIPKSMKYTKPVRLQPVRAIGESEARIYVSYAGPDITADIMDRNNSAVSHGAMVDSILSADKPSNIEKGIDRSIFKLGGSKPLQIVKHVLECAGMEFIYKKA